MTDVGVFMNVLKLLASILQGNRIVIDDGEATLSPVTQTTGLAQKKTKPTFILHYAEEFSDRIRGLKKSVKVILHAGTLVPNGSNGFQV